jgi:hypothetical protein
VQYRAHPSDTPLEERRTDADDALVLTDEMLDAELERMFDEAWDYDSCMEFLHGPHVGRAERQWLFRAYADETGLWGLSDADYWRLVGEMWIDAEYPGRQAEFWAWLWTTPERADSRSLVMTDEERAELAALPALVTVYRGYGGSGDEWSGFSWTLDRERAEFFGRRCSFLSEGWLAVAQVPRASILALLCGRQEVEVVLAPSDEHVTLLAQERVR